MTSKIIVNTIEADTGISSVTFASNINLQNDSSILVSSSGVTLGTGSTIAAPSANELALSTNSAERLRITSGGLVGINTDIPSNTLQVVDTSGTAGSIDWGPSANRGRLYASSSGIFVGSVSNHDLILRTNNTERLRITSSGFMGLGTNAPAMPLDVHGADTNANGLGDVKGQLRIFNDTTAFGSSPRAGVVFSTKYRTSPDVPLDGAAIYGGKQNGSDANKDFFLAFATRSESPNEAVERMRIDSAGKVGIGTENPLNGVDIVQSDSRTRVTAYGHIITRNHNHSVTNYWSIAPRNGGELDIAYGPADSNGTVAADLVTIKSDGKIGFNASNPPRDYCFHSGQADTNIQITNNTTGIDDSAGSLIQQDGNNLYIWNKENGFMSLGTNAVERMRILPTGGLTFNGDTAQANALNDYEEGTLGWRLQRSNAIGSGSNHSDTRISYTKVGNRVYVSGYLYTANTGNSTGIVVELRDNSNVNNYATLPYVPNQAGGFPITGTRTIDDSYRNMAVTFRQGQAQVYIYNDDGNNAYLKNSNNVNIGSTQTHLVIQFCGSYTTNS